MLNSSDIFRGFSDTIILAQLEEEDSYGYSISKTISEKTDGALELKEGTLYTTFRRLESAGMIESYWGTEQAGARRRYYHLTQRGREVLEENKRDWKHYEKLLQKVLNQGRII